MATRTPKNGHAHTDVADVAAEVESGLTDLQAAGEARYNEIAELVRAQVLVIDTARAEIVTLIRPIRDESLWVFGRDDEGEAFTNWKNAVRHLLGGAFGHWSKQAKSGIIVMLIDEGFTVAEAAEVTDSTPGEAKAAVKEADDEAQGVEPAEVTPPAEVTKEAKSVKVIDQAIAQNKRTAEALYDAPLASLQALDISMRELHSQVKALIEKRVADEAGTTAA